ncbi:hypothetical protein BRADI_4g24522v3 [Brachypodium distachyon]|uniref:F-box domain-containing protein n=1 Tax=Brachypodium distachyon TaxID=15368 RepID=A0A0Q3ENY9_BRADI|nr:hypothetical protein BRADI_4g24522v3 [Brachypodium distachyon]
MSANNPSPSLVLSLGLGLPNSPAPIIRRRSSSPAPPPPLHDDDRDDPSLALTLALPTPRSRRHHGSSSQALDDDNDDEPSLALSLALPTPRRSRHHGSSSPLEDEDLLREILVRLPPQPSLLPRASLVSKRWLHLVSETRFARRFRLHHRRNSPIFGLFIEDQRQQAISFVPTGGAPLPMGPYPRLRFQNLDSFKLLGCRHGLLLILHLTWNKFLVWDIIHRGGYCINVPPGMESEQRSMLAMSPGLGMGLTTINGAVVRVSRDDDNGRRCPHFKVVVVVIDEAQPTRLLACVYSSETGVWGQFVSTPPPPEDAVPARFFPGRSAVLLGNSIYWLLTDSLAAILEYDMGRQTLNLIEVPVDIYAESINDSMVMSAAEGVGCLGFLVVTDIGTAQFWKRNMTDSASSWVLVTSIDLNNNDLLPLAPGTKSGDIMVLGFAEDSNAAFLSTPVGLFMVRLDALQMGVSSWVQAGTFMVNKMELNFCTIH